MIVFFTYVYMICPNAPINTRITKKKKCITQNGHKYGCVMLINFTTHICTSQPFFLYTKRARSKEKEKEN